MQASPETETRHDPTLRYNLFSPACRDSHWFSTAFKNACDTGLMELRDAKVKSFHEKADDGRE